MGQVNNTDSIVAAAQSDFRPANLCILVIFGVAGDLTKRLLYPAICNLGGNGLLAKGFCIVGVAKEPFNTDTFREQLSKDINEFITDPVSKKYGLELLNRVHYLSGDFSDPLVYAELKTKLESLSEASSKNYLFYLASPPEFISVISTGLDRAKLLSEENESFFRRIVVEKPFGHDLESAKKLNLELLSIVKESQIFRIDHFLGKETVQNLLAFRFSNGLFEPIWSNLYIDHIQITVAETLGIELRGGYYEETGAMRDMLPNHIFQVLSFITMEPPASFSAENILEEKIKALRAIQPLIPPEQVLQQTVRGQYGPGMIDSKKVIGYRSEKNVSPESSTETYVAVKFLIDNWRWLNVPFYLRTGKRMKAHTSEIVIQFKSGPSTLFGDIDHGVVPNLLRIFIQPDEGISLQFNAKIPGPTLKLDKVNMSFKYKDYFGVKPQTGYETILYDCMNGDHMLFKQAAIVETGWALVQPILDVWGALKPRDFPNYAAGSWGPKEADNLLLKDGRQWLL